MTNIGTMELTAIGKSDTPGLNGNNIITTGLNLLRKVMNTKGCRTVVLNGS